MLEVVNINSITITIVFHMFKKLEEWSNVLCRDTEEKLLEMKTTMSEKKNALNEIDVRINIVKIKIDDFKDLTMET